MSVLYLLNRGLGGPQTWSARLFVPKSEPRYICQPVEVTLPAEVLRLLVTVITSHALSVLYILCEFFRNLIVYVPSAIQMLPCALSTCISEQSRKRVVCILKCDYKILLLSP